ncbi:GtrA family protein [Rhizobium leguminosarum]|uniref:GtrA family protein n=1 Tax=Rhizobium leguminosarum TaxID=384 RepID=UPI001C959B87|nr:GtrA family protein [Rhizobium leguminosarum]MBY5447179.1 GtrA family protein [Rhizobium leguminosarum]
MLSHYAREGMSTRIAVRYVAFAILSTLTNFAVQAAVVKIYPSQSLVPSMLAGTAAGFGLKYFLDKRWIFFDRYESHGDELLKIVLYGLFSVVTTIIFWGFETAFWTVWRTDLAKYAGGAIGLAIGYVSKFALDRKFVFKLQGA